MMNRRRFVLIALTGAIVIALGGIVTIAGDFESKKHNSVEIVSHTVLKPNVEVEEKVYDYISANNGAGPMWCHGGTSIIRTGNKVIASGLETVAEWKPLNNCRWMLFERTEYGWKKKLVNKDRTREPVPLAAFHDGRFFLSANPTLTDSTRGNGPSRPEILLFNGFDEQLKYETLSTIWADNAPFTEHSYRSLVTDGALNELVLFQNVGNANPATDFFTLWSFLDATGKWSSQGQLRWPMGTDYEIPQPIRICYPTVMLKDRALYFCGVSDIVEPKKAWREYKRQITGKQWDYDFRRLFFTWSDELASGKFHPWIEIASREETCGKIMPSDLWVDPGGAVHLLWTEQAIDERLREKFFPDAKQSHALNYAIVRNGKVEVRRSLAIANEGVNNEKPGAARFQVAPGNRLFVVYFVSGSNSAGQEIAENRLLELTSDGIPGSPVTIPLKLPFTNFFTATVRAGSQPSQLIDMYGEVNGHNNEIHYARIRINY